MRKQAFQDLDQALIQILRDTMRYLQDTNAPFDPMSKSTYDYYAANRL